MASIAENDSPEEKRDEIDTLYEAIQLFQISVFKPANDNVRYNDPKTGISWEFHKPGYHSVRTNEGCCAASTSWLHYVLQGDYEEFGFIEIAWHDEWYYIIDKTHYKTEAVLRGSAPVESGILQDFYGSDRALGPIFRVRNLKDYMCYLVDYLNLADLGLVLSYVPPSPEALPISFRNSRRGLEYRINPSAKRTL